MTDPAAPHATADVSNETGVMSSGPELGRRAGDRLANHRVGSHTRRRLGLFASAGILAAAALTFFGLFWVIDLAIQQHESAFSPAGFGVFFHFDIETLQNTLGSLAQIIVAVLGIAITVVSIVVQLAATRYSSHIANLFFRDRTNLAIMGFFVVACIDVVWVSLGVHTDFMPLASVVASLVVLTGSLLMLIPYFAYVFDFLDPARVIAQIGQSTLDAAIKRRPSQGKSVTARHDVAATSLERLADVAVNSVAQKDKVIASQAVATLRDVLVSYLREKPRLPNKWFKVGERLRQDADFAVMAPESILQIEEDQTWFEWKGLRQLRLVFAESLKSLPEVAHGVAVATRRIGEAAVAINDRKAIAAAIKFFNTYLRTALNASDVRSAYNVLNEYRHMTEEIMHSGMDGLTLQIAQHFKYYGQIAHAMGLGFVTETAAYDLSVLCEKAFAQKALCHADLLQVFLEVDKEAETLAEEKALRGVRKAQVRLATYYMVNNEEALARTIFEDMRAETPLRLTSIRAELEAVDAKDFWEVTDRGINFDYLDPRRKAQLDAFFAWFGDLPRKVTRLTPAPGEPNPPIL
ncbi:MAG: DUF2254 family protein [Deltaproteobacteria bacterium]|nr:DUF2254 family protein [Deltaproteobacteria bacterium]